MLVTDASAWLGSVFPEQDSGYPKAVGLEVDRVGGQVPWIFWFEVRHVVLLGERQGTAPAAAAADFLERLQRLPLRFDVEPESSQVLQLARRHHLSVYDAAYLELAQRSGSALASLDKRLNRAAEAEGVPTFSAGG